MPTRIGAPAATARRKTASPAPELNKSLEHVGADIAEPIDQMKLIVEDQVIGVDGGGDDKGGTAMPPLNPDARLWG